MRKKGKRNITLLLAVLSLLTLFVGYTGRSGAAESPMPENAALRPENMAGKKIGVLSGTVGDILAGEQFPECELEYYNTLSDMVLGLDNGKIAAMVEDEPVIRQLRKTYPRLRTVHVFMKEDYGFVFGKNEENRRIRDEFDAFVEDLRTGGMLQELEDIWFGTDESLQDVDYSSLTGENGTLNFIVCSDVGAPFCYRKDDKYIGYEVDLAVRFCREMGYDLELTDSAFMGVLAAVTSGKSDMGAACITITEERKDSMNFSVPTYHGGLLLATMEDENGDALAQWQEKLAGKKIAVSTGTMFDAVTELYFPASTVEYMNSTADLGVALDSGKVAAYITDEPLARILMAKNPGASEAFLLEKVDYGFMFQKDSPYHDALCAQFNEFLAQCRSDGTLEELDEIWFGTDESRQFVDYSGLTGENGAVKFAVCTDAGAPFVYLRGDQYAGYDVDLGVRFCRAYGYDPEITDYPIAAIMAATTTEKADFAAACIGITKERQETMLFSDTYYLGGAVLVTPVEGADSGRKDLFRSVWESFEKTFIREGRWKLFLEGIGTTLLITVCAAVLGTALGFAGYLLYRREFPLPNAILRILMDILEKTPVVVILMILYYILFGKSDLDGVWVSVLGFTLMVAGSVIGLLHTGVGAVDRGQREAALAMGYTERQAFLRVILPQAARHFLPGYKSEIVALIKSTAIVGYIAVQDLTKVGDIVRSRTYEAFFPLIATALIYYALAWLLTGLVRHMEIANDPRHRRVETILKGVQRK